MEEPFSTISSSDSEFWQELKEVIPIQEPVLDFLRPKSPFDLHRLDLLNSGEINYERKLSYYSPSINQATQSIQYTIPQDASSEVVERLRKAKEQEIQSMSIKVKNQTRVFPT
jgi:hypothetical protein